MKIDEFKKELIKDYENLITLFNNQLINTRTFCYFVVCRRQNQRNTRSDMKTYCIAPQSSNIE